MHNLNLRLVAAAVCLAGTFACDRIGGKKIAVDFRSAEGIKGGEAVYAAGVKIGTTGEPTLVGGRALVPVTLERKHKEALAAGAVFLVKTDPSDARKLSLAATSCGEGRPGQVPPDTYRGASNGLELVAMCGAEKAKQLFEELTR